MKRSLFPAAAVALGLLFLYLGWRCMGFYSVGAFNDDAGYLIQARQFATTGQVLRLANDPQRRPSPYPPGHSILLAPFVLLSGGNETVLRFVPLACMLVAGGCFGWVAALALGRGTGLAVAAAFLLGPGPLTFGSTLLSDVSFTMWVALCLVWTARAMRSPPSLAASIALGLALAFAVLIRLPGAVLLVAVFSALWTQHGWRRTWPTLAAAITLVLCYLWLSRAASGAGYLGQALANIGTASRLAQHLSGFWGGLPTVLSRVFLGADAAWAAVLLLLGGAVGVWRAWRFIELRPLALFAPLYLAFYMLWPFVDPRFYMPLWPCLLILNASLLPSGWTWALPLAATLMAVQAVPRVVGQSTSRAVATRDGAYRWLAQHAPLDEIVMSPYAFRAYLHSGHPTSQQPSVAQTAQLLDAAARENARWLVVETSAATSLTTLGQNMVAQPAFLTAWLDASTLVRREVDADGERVYRMVVEGQRMKQAYADYTLAASLNWGTQGGEAERLFRNALKLVPDFPEAKALLAVLLLERNAPRKQAIALLQNIVRQYPMDVTSAVNLAQALRQEKQHDAARTVLQTAHVQAVRYGMQREAALIEQLLGGR